MLITSDSTADAVVVITGRVVPGTAYTAVTPANANSAPPNPGPNYLGIINLATGNITAPTVSGVIVQPKGLLFLPAD